MSLTNENQDVKVPWWFNEESSRMLNGGYLLRGENLDGALERITSAAAKRLKRPDLKEKFKEIVWNGWMSLSSPIWANMGTQRGLPISCLLNDTLIEVKSGDVHLTMTIEELTKRWDEGVRNFQIKVFNTDTKTIEYSKINRVWETKNTKSLVYLSVGEAGTNNIRCTPDHLILMSNGEYKPAEEIKPLDKLQGESYKTVVEVKNVEAEEEVSVFDIEVDHPSHNFYLPEAEVFVHNCFGVNVPDSLNLISDKLKEVTMQTKIGGGTSGYFGNIRERGAKIKDNGESSGPVPFMQLFDTTMGVVSQGGVRRGAFAAYLDIDHPDFEEFLQVRDIGNPIQNLFTGACIPDYWMQEMVDGDMEKRRIWAKVLESRQQKGMPYLFFTDNVNKNKPQVYKDKKMQITHSNLCFTGDNKVFTNIAGENKEISFESLYSKFGKGEGLEDLKVWCKDDGEIKQVGVKEVMLVGYTSELTRLTFDSGYTVDCTPDHRFLLDGGDYKEAQYLTPEDKLASSGAYGLNEVEAVSIKGNQLIQLQEKIPVYCLEVLNNSHNFLLSIDNQGVIVSNCSEISTPDGPDESFVCCLSSLNLELYDEWKNTDTVKLAIYFLDAVMSEFIENSADIPGLEAVNKFARRHRSLGLGKESVKCPV